MILLFIMFLALFRFLFKKLLFVAGIIYSFSGSTILVLSALSIIFRYYPNNNMFAVVGIFQICIGVGLLLLYSIIQKNNSKKELENCKDHTIEYKVEILPEFESWYKQYKQTTENSDK